ncbi:UNVERIFIED_CONTAM: hypothetical protein FKN15_020257 [Acipenser sinensis]
MYEETMTCYNIANKLSGIVTDNAANMVKAFTIFPPSDVPDSDTDQDVSTDIVDLVNVSEELDYLPPEWSPCFAHTLQLVVRDALEQAGPIKAVIAKVSKLVSFCHKSTKVLVGHFKLQISNATRWNSQLKMMRSILRVPAEVLSELHATCKLSPYELKLIGKLCEILEPFEEATDMCQGNQVVTASYVIACVQGLHHAVAHIRETCNSKFVVTMQSSLEKCLDKFEEMECFQMAATLDPRFILDWCMFEEENSIRELLTNKVISLSPEVDAMCDRLAAVMTSDQKESRTEAVMMIETELQWLRSVRLLNKIKGLNRKQDTALEAKINRQTKRINTKQTVDGQTNKHEFDYVMVVHRADLPSVANSTKQTVASHTTNSRYVAN